MFWPIHHLRQKANVTRTNGNNARCLGPEPTIQSGRRTSASVRIPDSMRTSARVQKGLRPDITGAEGTSFGAVDIRRAILVGLTPSA
jgi:hypothetical protein